MFIACEGNEFCTKTEGLTQKIFKSPEVFQSPEGYEHQVMPVVHTVLYFPSKANKIKKLIRFFQIVRFFYIGFNSVSITTTQFVYLWVRTLNDVKYE